MITNSETPFHLHFLSRNLFVISQYRLNTILLITHQPLNIIHHSPLDTWDHPPSFNLTFECLPLPRERWDDLDIPQGTQAMEQNHTHTDTHTYDHFILFTQPVKGPVERKCKKRANKGQNGWLVEGVSLWLYCVMFNV